MLQDIALWERFAPYQEHSPDWKSYKAFAGDRSDTVSKRIRMLSLAQLVRQVSRVEGSFAECGCGAGGSADIIARAMTRCGRNDRLLLFDSFEGLSRPSPEDFQRSPAHIDMFGIQTGLANGRKFFAADLSAAQASLAGHDFIEFFKGWIPERFGEVADRRFAFVHIDVDLYRPTKASLEFFYPRLGDGGVIQIDDYNFMDWPGATKAVDEFLASANPRFFYQLALGGAFLIK